MKGVKGGRDEEQKKGGRDGCSGGRRGQGALLCLCLGRAAAWAGGVGMDVKGVRLKRETKGSDGRGFDAPTKQRMEYARCRKPD